MYKHLFSFKVFYKICLFYICGKQPTLFISIKTMNYYTVINASAGSGKTYTLVKNLLKICLKNDRPELIGNILALTFTNKAAGEMKERILSWLKDYTSEKYMSNPSLINIQQELKQEGDTLSMDQLRDRSQRLLDYILHHYSTLNISTIDKFNSRLIRSFALELGLPQNFNLEVDPTPFITEAVEQTLDKIGEDPQISKAFIDYINYNLENDEKINIQQTLNKKADEYNSDIHYNQLKKNKNFDWDAYTTEKEKLRKEIQQLKKESLQICKAAQGLIKAQELTTSDFAGGKKNSIAVFFDKFLQKNIPALPSKSEEQATEIFEKGSSSSSKKRQNEILSILPLLLDSRKRIIRNYIEIEKKKKIHQALLPLKINKEIQDQLKIIEDENDLLLLSRFNIMINEQLKDEPSAFIYEKIGEKFQHFFFDEFQDTSLLQWQNFVPLRDNALSEADTSFSIVGDPKQSIYRFRGGDAKIMLDIINKKEITPKYAETIVLGHNYRSSFNIVQFNNELYKFISTTLDDDYRSIFGESAIQIPHSKNPGRVRVNLIENEKKEQFYIDSCEKMREDIQQCLDNGYQLSDIAILCRGNHDISEFTSKLSAMQVNYQGKEIFIKTISDSGLTLDLSPTVNATIEYLKWYIDPKDLQALAFCLYYLNQSGRITMVDFSQEFSELIALDNSEDIIAKIRQLYHLNFHIDHQNLNTYSFIENVLQNFSVQGEETVYLINFLELLYAYFQNTAANLKDFIQFWKDKGHQTNIQVSENVDAIQLLTIHKSKGLEFPIVFLPFVYENTDNKIEDWMDVNDEQSALRSVNVKKFDNSIASYHEDLQEFNTRNIYKNKIDKLCLLYVATTRAVDQMFFYIQKTINPEFEIYNFINTKKPQHNEEEEQVSENNEDSFDIFPISDIDLLKRKKEEQNSTIEEYHIQSLQPEDTGISTEIKIATPSKSYQERNESVKTGIFTHSILEKIITREDAPRVLKQFLLDGTITKEEHQAIQERISHLFEEHSEYFDGRYTVVNEREILYSQNGESIVLRPDRLMKSPEGWLIIDFKTGAEHEKYEEQVDTYKKALEAAGEKVWKTEILYL